MLTEVQHSRSTLGYPKVWPADIQVVAHLPSFSGLQKVIEDNFFSWLVWVCRWVISSFNSYTVLYHFKAFLLPQMDRYCKCGQCVSPVCYRVQDVRVWSPGTIEYVCFWPKSIRTAQSFPPQEASTDHIWHDHAPQLCDSKCIIKICMQKPTICTFFYSSCLLHRCDCCVIELNVDTVCPTRHNMPVKEPHLVVMTMRSTICSHTIRQKSTKVFGKGPEGHKSLSVH